MDFKCDELILGKTDADSRALTYKRNERLVAAIQIEASGQARFYLDARQISMN